MQPTYNNNDIVFIKKNRQAENGDIIVFTSPQSWKFREEKDYLLIKRIFAKAGDTVIFNNQGVSVNGEYKDMLSNCPFAESEDKFVLKKEEYIVLGDNTADSNDSYFRYCMGEKEYIITEDKIIFYGKEVLKLKGGYKWAK